MTNDQVTEATIAGTVRAMRRLFSFLAQENIIAENPAAHNPAASG